jgi:hypothetical protein
MMDGDAIPSSRTPVQRFISPGTEKRHLKEQALDEKPHIDSMSGDHQIHSPVNVHRFV